MADINALVDICWSRRQTSYFRIQDPHAPMTSFYDRTAASKPRRAECVTEWSSALIRWTACIFNLHQSMLGSIPWRHKSPINASPVGVRIDTHSTQLTSQSAVWRPPPPAVDSPGRTRLCEHARTQTSGDVFTGGRYSTIDAISIWLCRRRSPNHLSAAEWMSPKFSWRWDGFKTHRSISLTTGPLLSHRHCSCCQQITSARWQFGDLLMDTEWM